LIGFNYALCTPRYMVLTQSGSLQEHWSGYVNDLLYDETIRLAVAEGCERLDFGASSLGDKNHNHFKESFGGEVRFFVEPYVPVLTRYMRTARDILQARAQSAFLKIRGQ
jgi:lipid II:glycine glycyltransferase (peptidoglycan interpeptide bridge formation enzyme)